MRAIFGGKRNIGGCWRMTPVALRNVNHVSAVFQDLSDILECHFSWQAQYLVILGGDSCCSAQCK